MSPKTVLTIIFVSFVFAAAGFAAPGAPSFSPMVYADGEPWGTKATATLPAPNDHNQQSFDKLFVFVNGADGQLPVGEAAPGNRYYNGGRWATQTVVWTEDAIQINDPLPVLRSYDEVMQHKSLGDLVIVPGPPMGGPPPAYFQCPLLPVK